MKKNTCKECKYSSRMIGIGMGFRCSKIENVSAHWNINQLNPALIPNQEFICDYFEKKVSSNKPHNKKEIIVNIPTWTNYLDIDKLSQWRHTYDEFTQKVQELHLMLFPEEYHTHELQDSKNKLLSSEFVNKVNLKRKNLKVSLITINGKVEDSSSIDYCKEIVKEENNFITYDFIADVHGRYSLLKEKLIQLGYQEKEGTFVSKNRQAIFLGDLVDRGDEVGETLKLVKKMCEDGVAQAVLGNHDWNWLMYNTKDEQGNFLRMHNEKNAKQNEKTRSAWELLNVRERQEILNWLSTLPLTIETEKYRVIHACWSIDIIKKLKQSVYPNEINFGSLKKILTQNKTPKTQKIKAYTEILLSGIEYKLPQNITFKDVDGNIRNAVRLKWWCLNETNELKDLALQPELVVGINQKISSNYQFEKEKKPTFFGHYHNKTYTFSKVNQLYSLDIQNDIGICSIHEFENQNTYKFN